MPAFKSVARLSLAVAIALVIVGWLWQHRSDPGREVRQREADVGDLTPQASSAPRASAGEGRNVSEDAKAGKDADEHNAAMPMTGHENESAQQLPAQSRVDSQKLTIAPLNSATLERWRDSIYADCHGQEIADCTSLLKVFSETLRAADNIEDGWSKWMEREILNSLHERSQVNRFTQVGAKCTSTSCVFLLVSKSASEMFGGPQNHNEFNRWLRAQAWNAELQEKSKLNGEVSTLAWEVYGLATQPYYVWYVVVKRD